MFLFLDTIQFSDKRLYVVVRTESDNDLSASFIVFLDADFLRKKPFEVLHQPRVAFGEFFVGFGLAGLCRVEFLDRFFDLTDRQAFLDRFLEQGDLLLLGLQVDQRPA